MNDFKTTILFITKEIEWRRYLDDMRQSGAIIPENTSAIIITFGKERCEYMIERMYKSGFKTIRLSLETSNSERQKADMGSKVSNYHLNTQCATASYHLKQLRGH